MTAQIIDFPSPSARRLRAAVLKYKKALCQSCKTTKTVAIKRSKLCYGIKRFVFFGKVVCTSKSAHLHVKCSNCGHDWVEE